MTHIKLVETSDGSWTCFNTSVNEHYHNLSGAYSETMNIYVGPSEMEKRLERSNHLVALDPFLGLGYNTMTCLQKFYSLKTTQFSDARLTLVAFENDAEILARLPQVMEDCELDDLKKFLPRLAHKIYYQTQSDLSDLMENGQFDDELGIRIFVVVGDTRQLVQQLPDAAFGIIHHDAFSPRAQPELWTQQLFQQYYRILNPVDGTVITYSASASMRKAFMEAGFKVAPLTIGWKKPGTRASKNPAMEPNTLTQLESALMECKSGIPYQDNKTLTRTREQIVEARDQVYNNSLLINSSSVHREYGYLRDKYSIT